MRFAKQILSHSVLIVFVLLMLMPLYIAVVAASHDGYAMLQAQIPSIPGTQLLTNIKTVLTSGILSTDGQPVYTMLLNSFIMALVITVGKILLAITSAFALVYFDFPCKKICFALIFATMMVPIEVRIIPTFQIVASFNMLNSFSGLTLPLLASATGTFLFRQFFKTIPKELVDAARLDGAGPLRFFLDIVLPLSRPQIASLFVILFVYGWNQYLWPLITTTETNMTTIVMGIRYLAGVADQVPEWHYVMTIALIALIPPCTLVMLMQRWFEKGLK